MKYVKIAVLALTLIVLTLPEMAMACRHRRCRDCCCEIELQFVQFVWLKLQLRLQRRLPGCSGSGS